MLQYACVGRSALKGVKPPDYIVQLGLLLTEDMVTFGYDIGVLLIKEVAPLAVIIGLLLIKAVITFSYNMRVLLTKKLVASDYDVLLLKTKGLNDPNLTYHCHKWRGHVSYFERLTGMLAGKLVIQATAFQYFS